MIPKIVHYCWFGGKPLPKKVLYYIESWKKYLPEWEVKCWNESNFDVNVHPYSAFCYAQKKWAYLSDFVRLKVVETYGGVYFDIDVELIRRDATLFDSEEVTAFFGFELPTYINTGIGFGATPHHKAIKAMLAEYEADDVVNTCQKLARGEEVQMIGCPALNTRALQAYGLRLDGSLQEVCGARVLPIDWMCPMDELTGVVHKTPNTISIHWFMGSPHSSYLVWRARLMRPVRRLLAFLRR